MTDILQAIKDGRYPTDEKNRALVPTREGKVCVVISTEGLGSQPIVGYIPERDAMVRSFCADGKFFYPPSKEESHNDLMPPVKEEIKVDCWVAFSFSGIDSSGKKIYQMIYVHPDEEMTRRFASGSKDCVVRHLVHTFLEE